MLKKFILACVFALGFSAPAAAQGIPGTSIVVSTCGTPPSSYIAGQNQPNLQDVTGRQCSSSTFTGTFTNPVGTTPTDRTITSATGASQQIMGANLSRHSLTIENTGNANCGVNPTGGTASIGGAGTLTLLPFGAYTPRVPTLSAVTIICSAGQPIYADEN